VNSFPVVVTAENGATRTYNISVTRAAPLSSDATLRSLSLGNVALSPAFNANTVNYTASIANHVTSVTISATANHSAATVVGTGSKSLNVGANSFPVVVTAENGATLTYNITVTRAGIASSDATLRSLSLENVALSPAFNANTVNYTANVASSVTAITIVATATHAGATVAGTGYQPLNAGTNSFRVTVTAESGATKTYYLTVVRETHLSSDATLKSLSIGNIALQPSFKPGTTQYTASVANRTATVTVAAVANDPKATVTGTGSKSLAVGANVFPVTVTAENGATRTYTVTVTRAAAAYSPSDATLKALSIDTGTLSPAFSPTTVNYTTSVADAVTTVTITAEATQAKAKVAGAGTYQLAAGVNRFVVAVTAENSTTTAAYTVTVVRGTFYDNRLTHFAASEGALTPDFDPDVTNYTLDMPCGIAGVPYTVSPPAGGSAECFINGAQADGYFILKPGVNSLLIRSRSVNGTVLDYNVTVIRPFDSSLTVRYWNDVLAVNLNTKTNGGQRFDAFQWMKNGVVLKGETSPYLYGSVGKLPAGDYSVILSVGGHSVATCPLSVADRTKSKNSLTAYPNPVSSTVTVETVASGTNIMLFDLNGRLLHSFPAETVQTVIDLSAYSAGMYILRHAGQSAIIIKPLN
jgi:hypothetical protein